ncbi:tellurium resistance protein [Pararhodobacter sp. SW119]|uniref:SLAC1 family transporter n=1 Tax=Pararhodobacter sp. SW119 TaxID=2780075 RepID=UPI001ADFB483|nr:tellurium resistance protein [Pararhodobacter sp. SW119]
MTKSKRHFPPPPPLPSTPPGLWQRVPPAIFPPIMGLLGLGLAWRTLGAEIPVIAGLAEAFLGGAVLLFAFAAVALASKPLRRPGVHAEELRVLPGRAGVSAGVLCVMLTAAALVPYAPGLAGGLVWVGVALLAGLGVMIARNFLKGPEEARVVTPFFHLVFVGYILAPLALIPLGQVGVARAIFWITLVIALLIWAESLRQLATRVPPAPLRPLLAIHLAPVSLFATVAALLGWGELALGFAVAGLALLAVLVMAGRWLLAAGFTPFWGALTFPLAALASAVLRALPDPAGAWLGAALVLAATGLNMPVAVRILRDWAQGGLAAKTNAAAISVPRDGVTGGSRNPQDGAAGRRG